MFDKVMVPMIVHLDSFKNSQPQKVFVEWRTFPEITTTIYNKWVELYENALGKGSFEKFCNEILDFRFTHESIVQRDGALVIERTAAELMAIEYLVQACEIPY